jgi:uncharacterized RDD family membrane protein YckC
MSPVFAGFWIRAMAHLVDFLIWNIIELAIEYGITLPLHLSTVSQQVVSVIATLVIPYVYYVEWPLRKGTTIGKGIFGIWVVDSRTGAPMSRKQAIGRLYAYLASYVILGCGFLMVAFHPQKRGLHEWISGTHSIRTRRNAFTSVSDPTALSKTDGAR